MRPDKVTTSGCFFPPVKRTTEPSKRKERTANRLCLNRPRIIAYSRSFVPCSLSGTSGEQSHATGGVR